MDILSRPLVLVHGLWNTPRLFSRLLATLNQPDHLVLAPYLPHQLGRKSIRYLAKELDSQINEKFGFSLPIDILGFSMGGLISRVWLQEMGGFKRTRRFFSIGSPHQGTLTAQIAPAFIFAGIAEMKLGSLLIESLNKNPLDLSNIDCRSYFTFWDLMVFPGNRAVLPYGTCVSVPVLTHKDLIKHSRSLSLISKDLLLTRNDELKLL